MRVLHIGKYFPPHPGGIERTSAELCQALTARDVDVAMLAHAQSGTHRSRTHRVGEVHVTLAACHGQWLYAPISPTFPRLLESVIRHFRPDLLHLHLPNTSAFWALLLPSARRLPWVAHWHSDIPLNTSRRGLLLAYRVYRPWEQALLRRARAIIATSTPYVESSTALAPWRQKITVIPLGLPPLAPTPPTTSEREGMSGLDATNVGSDADAPTPPPALSAITRDGTEAETFDWPGPGLRLLAVGRLSHYKGFDVLLRAIAQTPGVSMVLAGSGECDAALRKLAQELGLSARVAFAGHVDEGTLNRLYARAQAFCLPSIERSEAFGVVLLEAMRASLPTLASDIPGSGVGFVVRPGETGLLVPPGDARALAGALQQMANGSGLRQRLGTAGQLRWLEEFTLDRQADRTLVLYRQLLSC